MDHISNDFFCRPKIDRHSRAAQKGHATKKLSEVFVPMAFGSVRNRDDGHRRLDPYLEICDRSQIRMARQPILSSHGTGALSGSCFGRSGKSRAPSPKRKMVAAMRPTDTPHSNNVGV